MERINYLIRAQNIFTSEIGNDNFEERIFKILEQAVIEYRFNIFNGESSITDNFISNFKTFLTAQLLFKAEENKKFGKKIINAYEHLLKLSADIVIQKIYNCKFNEIEQCISEFMQLSQFLETNTLVSSYDNSLLKKYNFQMVSFAARIVNLLMTNKIDYQLKDLIQIILFRVNEILLPDVDFELYDEILPSVDFHEVKYSRIFFVAYSLLFVENKYLSSIVDKIYIEKSGYKREYTLSQLIKQFDNYTDNDVKNLKLEDIEERIHAVKQEIATRIDQIKKDQLEDISKEKIPQDRFDDELSAIRKELNDFIKKCEDKSKYKSIPQKLELQFPKLYLLNESGNYFYYLDSIRQVTYEYIFRHCMKNIDIEEIDSISSGIKSKSNILLPKAFYLPAHERDNIYSNFGNYEFTSKMGDKLYNLIKVNSSGVMVTIEEIQDGIFLLKDDIRIDNIKEEVDNGNVIIKCDLILPFMIDMNFKFKGYTFS